MNELVFVMSKVEEMKDVGIDTEGLRKSIDGTKAIIHIEFVKDEQLVLLARKGELKCLKNDELHQALHNKEWEGENWDKEQPY